MKATAKDFASLTLDERGLCDLELLAIGAFSPLKGFLGRADYERVVAEARLADGTLWPLPVVLPVAPGNGVEVGRPLALRDVCQRRLGAPVRLSKSTTGEAWNRTGPGRASRTASTSPSGPRPSGYFSLTIA